MRGNITKSLQAFGKRGVVERSKTDPMALHGSEMGFRTIILLQSKHM
jgi:hypothetical protein